MKAINLCFIFTIVRVFKNELDPLDSLEIETFQFKFLDEREMLELARNPDNKLNEAFVRAALEKGDECYAGFDGEELACIAWYSNKPTDDEGLVFHFSPDYMYVYAGVTYPKYRGRRLNVVRANRARRAYISRGFKGLIYNVDSHNFGSLRAIRTPGNQEIGFIVALRIGRHAWIYNSRSCREHGIYLAKPAAAVRKRNHAVQSHH